MRHNLPTLNPAPNIFHYPPLEVAQFPANRPCGDYASLLKDEDTLFGFSPADLHESFDQVGQLTWQLEHAPGTIEVTCEIELPETLCIGSTGVREYLTTVTLTSSDGSLDGSFQVNVGTVVRPTTDHPLGHRRGSAWHSQDQGERPFG